jgi:hypothetical protein
MGAQAACRVLHALSVSRPLCLPGIGGRVSVRAASARVTGQDTMPSPLDDVIRDVFGVVGQRAGLGGAAG